MRVRVRVRPRMWVAGEGGVRLGALGELELQLELGDLLGSGLQPQAT